jgi:hypothetical protein
MNAWNVHYKEKPINGVSGNAGVFPEYRKRISTLCGQYALHCNVNLSLPTGHVMHQQV